MVSGNFFSGLGVKLAPPERVAALVKALDSQRYSERKDALEELKRLGDSALGELERVLEQQPTLEVRKRIEVVVEHVKSRERLRTLRAVEALELSGIQRRSERQHLECHSPTQGDLHGFVHDTHGAPAQLADDAEIAQRFRRRDHVLVCVPLLLRR